MLKFGLNGNQRLQKCVQSVPTPPQQALLPIDIKSKFHLSIIFPHRISCSHNRTQQVKIRICELVHHLYLFFKTNQTKMSKEISLASVKEHNKAEDLWVVIENKVYDLTKFLNEVGNKVDDAKLTYKCNKK